MVRTNGVQDIELKEKKSGAPSAIRKLLRVTDESQGKKGVTGVYMTQNSDSGRSSKIVR
jgi:hypothetical protein